MSLEIGKWGIVLRKDGGEVFVYVPGRNGVGGREIAVEVELADEFRPSTGDLLQGWEIPQPTDDKEPVITVASLVNGLKIEDSSDRPLPRPHRHTLERTSPTRPVLATLKPADMTARAIEFACPLGVGCAGLIYGPHASGLTRSLQTVVSCAVRASDLIVIVLLLNARGEEVTQWRRDLPGCDILECPSTFTGASAEETVLAANLALECAQRQTELGKHVFLAVDSLTALWAAMLEVEEADAQREADRAAARQPIRDWMLKAGSFEGEGLLGSGLGGSLTIVATAWHREIDLEAEEEGESHPHLRLLEHVLNDSNWRLKLSGGLAGQRLYPAIDLERSICTCEENILGDKEAAHRSKARRSLLDLPEADRHLQLMEAIEATSDNAGLVELLAGHKEEMSAEADPDDFWAGWSTGPVE
jgi:transcription termination factor Rho